MNRRNVTPPAVAEIDRVCPPLIASPSTDGPDESPPAPDPLANRVALAARAFMLAFRDAEGTEPLAVRLEIAERVARLALMMGG